jgi:hypothetical protein
MSAVCREGSVWQKAKLPDLLKSPPGEGTQENVLHFRYPAKSKTTYVTQIRSRFIGYFAISLHIILMHRSHTFAHFSPVSSTSQLRCIAHAPNLCELHLISPELRLFAYVSMRISIRNRRISLESRTLQAFARCSLSHSPIFRVSHSLSRLLIQNDEIAPDHPHAAGHAALQLLPFYYILRAWASRTTRNG